MALTVLDQMEEESDESSYEIEYKVCDQCGDEFRTNRALISHQRASKNCDLPESYQTTPEKAESVLSELDYEKDIDNIIYVLVGEINDEPAYYVGQTVQTFYERLKQHISTNKNTPFDEIKTVDRIVEVGDKDIDDLERDVALQVAIDYNTKNVFGPKL